MNASSGKHNFHQKDLSNTCLYLESTRVTPYVLLDQKRQCLIIKGRSCPDDSQNFYYQIDCALKVYGEDGGTKLVANFSLEYLNTGSIKCLFGLFRVLKELENKGLDIQINWYYNEVDKDMHEIGADYAELTDIKINLIAIV